MQQNKHLFPVLRVVVCVFTLVLVAGWAASGNSSMGSFVLTPE